MRIGRFTGVFVAVLLAVALVAAPASAVTVPFPNSPITGGGGGGGTGEVAPRGFGVDIVGGTPSRQWLSSGYDNQGFLAVYTGVVNGIDRLPLKNSDDSPFVFNAYVDKNPNVAAGYVLAIYENGTRVDSSRYALGTQVRDLPDPSGQASRWRVPITGLDLKPGSKYEFAFLSGIKGNNGVTGVVSADGTGYIQSPVAGVDLEHYDAHKGDEYRYREYAQTYDVVGGNYTTLVPNPAYDPAQQTFRTMRFSFVTDADPAPLLTALASARAARATIPADKIASGVYSSSAVAALDAAIAEMAAYSEDDLKAMLQSEVQALVDELTAVVAAALVQTPVAPGTGTTTTTTTTNPATGDGFVGMFGAAIAFATAGVSGIALTRRGVRRS